MFIQDAFQSSGDRFSFNTSEPRAPGISNDSLHLTRQTIAQDQQHHNSSHGHSHDVDHECLEDEEDADDDHDEEEDDDDEAEDEDDVDDDCDQENNPLNAEQHHQPSNDDDFGQPLTKTAKPNNHPPHMTRAPNSILTNGHNGADCHSNNSANNVLVARKPHTSSHVEFKLEQNMILN